MATRLKLTATQSHILCRVSDDNPGLIVESRQVGIRFPSGTLALHGLDLGVREGEFVSLVGPSGCGKSTFLRLVAGLLDPTEGQLTVGGLGPAQARKTSHSSGFVFQSPTLLPWRTVQENLVLPLELEGMPSSARRVVAEEWLERVGLTEFAKAWPAQLSGGMRMRVSIARALASRPRILLMDEPFAALDDITRGGLQEELLRLRSEIGFTTLFVTHNVSEAVFLSDRVVVMTGRPGRIQGEVAVGLGARRDDDLRGEASFASKIREVAHLLKMAKP
ncbi:MAG: ABC transporter ATP-binding protein [Fibrobacterota bacterium]|nr:MAG: ABC transporter ATP-binding protein [Fibrobacterota bacterium]